MPVEITLSITGDTPTEVLVLEDEQDTSWEQFAVVEPEMISGRFGKRERGAHGPVQDVNIAI